MEERVWNQERYDGRGYINGMRQEEAGQGVGRKRKRDFDSCVERKLDVCTMNLDGDDRNDIKGG
jgi:hypothetical protein